MFANLLAANVGAIVGGIVGAIVGIIILIVLLSFILFNVLFSRPRKYKVNGITRKMMGPELDRLNAFIAENRAELEKRECEQVQVESDDGLVFNGYFYSCGQPTDKCVILSHGFKSNCYNTYSPQALFYLDNGFDVMMMNHRGHELSEGAYSSFSIKEGHDLLKWVECMEQKNPNYKIMLHGNSMGATSVLIASKYVPESVKCIIGDCGFTSAKDELYVQMTTMFKLPKFLAKLLLGIIAFFCKTIGEFDLNAEGGIDAVKESKVPIMFVHGTNDATVPIEQGKANYDACCNENKRWLAYEGAGHGQSYLEYKEEYGKQMLDFANTYLK